MTVKIVEGNLLEATEDIIGHQVNCQGVMGSGVAGAIRHKYPKVYEEYKLLHKNSNPHYLLGRCQFVCVSNRKFVANLFGQFNYGRNKYRYTDYDALEDAMLHVLEFAENSNYSVALPYGIGCGLANGDWNTVYKIIEDVFYRVDCTLYKLKV